MKKIEGLTEGILRDLIKKLSLRHPGEKNYTCRLIRDLLDVSGLNEIKDQEIQSLLEQLEESNSEELLRVEAPEEDFHFRKEIIDYYIPKQLVDAIIANGGIPKDSIETHIGVGFIDVADYTFLAKFLSPKENQILLNGLYTSFSNVLRKHGGYLNKTEGDSIMFHFGGLIDPKVKNLNPKETLVYISTELFYTCIEMQRVCYLFNQADPVLLEVLPDEEEQHTVQSAFDIIHFMRNDSVMSNAFNALFQIRIRIGANVGEVSIGNFGPPGSKHWDVIGIAVIDAKRMESTAPVGGLRISEAFYNLLTENGIVDKYFQDFKQEAIKLGGYFREITKEELFYFGSVILKDKRNVTFRTFSVQVNPGLPEAIQDQINLLLQKGDIGAEKIVELVQYYRGNRHVIRAIEDLFIEKNIRIRKGKIIYYMFPKRYRQFLKKMKRDPNLVDDFVARRYQLFDLLKALGNYQDQLKMPYRAMEQPTAFRDYENYMNKEIGKVNDQYKRTIRNSIHNTYFFNVIFPLVFRSIKASILEYQYKMTHEEIADVTAVEEAEDIESLEEVEAL